MAGRNVFHAVTAFCFRFRSLFHPAGFNGDGNDVPDDVQGDSHAGLFKGDSGTRPSSQLQLKITTEFPAYGLRGLRTHRFKLVMDVSPSIGVSTMLFDLQEDPFELKGLLAFSPEVGAQLVENERKPCLMKTDDPWLQRLA